MIFKKWFIVVICLFAVSAVGAQSKQQQQILGRILTDQKQWQQSKMPTRTYYNRNYYYKMPMYTGTNLPNSGLSYYEIITVPKAERSHLSYRIKYPQNSPVYKQDSVYKNKSFVKFNTRYKGS